MKTVPVFILSLILFSLPCVVGAQSTFSADEYQQFLQNNTNLTSNELLSRHAPKTTYYTGKESGAFLDDYAFLDSTAIKYNLTEPELALLQKNHFVVTERLSFPSFGHALHDIYGKDLPVFVTTDAVLHALHYSYDQILKDLEISILEPNLVELTDALYRSFPELIAKYSADSQLQDSLGDIDLYVTMAKSLLAGEKLPPQYINSEKIDEIWDLVQAEEMVEIPLFSERKRWIDFSQFTVRGHYASERWQKYLGDYFKCMMWLGRIDFLLTPPPDYDGEPWTREDIRRMNINAVMLNELLDLSGARALMDANDEIITFMVGVSDNLTPVELTKILADNGLSDAGDLLDDSIFDAFQEALASSADYGQRILSNIFMMDPYSSEPDDLPISFRLMGQRFIVDSYIFSNVVYDRIIYEGEKIFRMMPDPLDIMFVLGNDDALVLLGEELDRYNYSSQLSALRYLVDAYDDDYWNISMYNTWLQAIRQLNPLSDKTGCPFFMQTVAWQQEKLNTQLASWAQLRHDTLLYAKQSYTGGTSCSFPHSFVEPYPEFYRQIGIYAESADAYFSGISSTGSMYYIQNYFRRFKQIMSTLETLARKELANEPFSEEEIAYLQRMLFIETGSGAPPFSGWYSEMFYHLEDSAEGDFPIADVHTQPTDEFGSIVGRVLHVGTGNINLGVFLADSPSNDYQPMAFVGPVMSYYETITNDFDRLTDERWEEIIRNNDQVPERPDWVNVYLADSSGNARAKGSELPGVLYSETGVEEDTPEEFMLIGNYPNPFNPYTTIEFSLGTEGFVTLELFNISGQKVATVFEGNLPAGVHSIFWNGQDVNSTTVSSGIYFSRLKMDDNVISHKMMMVK